jgi:hypothetical protein
VVTKQADFVFTAADGTVLLIIKYGLVHLFPLQYQSDHDPGANMVQK